MVVWYIFPRVGILHQEKSGNPGKKAPRKAQLIPTHRSAKVLTLIHWGNRFISTFTKEIFGGLRFSTKPEPRSISGHIN
jgi:hypothetical protein